MKDSQYFVLTYLWAFLCISSSIQAYVYKVTSLDDSGSGTLRELIGGLTDGDGIAFDSSLSGTIVLANSLPDITTNYFTLTGPSDNSISIDGNDLYRIFQITGNHATILNLNLLNGADTSQGGIVHVNPEKYTYLKNVNITPSSTANGINPIYLELDSTLDAEDVVFLSENRCDFFLNGTLNVTNNIDVQYTIDAAGGIVLIKYGAGVLHLRTDPLTIPDVQIQLWEGLLDFNGTIAQGIYLFSDASCQGTFDVNYVVNSGNLQPGNASTFGTITLTPNEFIQLPDNGNMIIKIDPSGVNDLIQTSSFASILGGTLTLVPSPGTYTAGTTYTIFLGSMGITGTFDSIFGGNLDVQIDYNRTSIDITILTTTII